MNAQQWPAWSAVKAENDGGSEGFVEEGGDSVNEEVEFSHEKVRAILREATAGESFLVAGSGRQAELE